MPIPEDWAAAICRWAAAEPRIDAIHIFGSRAKGTDHEGSDLDLALAISDAPDDSALAFWIFEAERMASSLGDMLPVRVDLQFQSPGDSVVGPAVAEHGIRLYRRQQASSPLY